MSAEESASAGHTSEHLAQASQGKDLASLSSPRILKILRFGEPILAAKAQEVADPTAPEVQRVIQDMLATACDNGHSAGLAGPQVNIPYRIIIVYNPTEGAEHSMTAMVNPRWEPASEEMESRWEGCLSAPGVVGFVSRYAHIRYSYQTTDGDGIHSQADGFLARIVQHECDHLEGITYLQRMTDMSKFMFEEEFIKYVRKPAQEEAQKNSDKPS
jgi:peptide deformylase